jgi:hypothetical protein
MPTSGDCLRTAAFVVVSYVLISRIRRYWRIGLISDESYLTQRPLLISGVLAFALFAGAIGLGVSEVALYWIAAVCVALPIGTWLLLPRPRDGSAQYPTILESVGNESVAPELTPLLYAVYEKAQGQSPNLASLRNALGELLEFLISKRGRTNANCAATDDFFLDTRNVWSKRWEYLPEAYQDILADMGSNLHEPESAPETAETINNTPKQLLERLKRLDARALHG